MSWFEFATVVAAAAAVDMFVSRVFQINFQYTIMNSKCAFNTCSNITLPVDGGFVDDAVDRLIQYYSVNYYSRLSLYLAYFDC